MGIGDEDPGATNAGGGGDGWREPCEEGGDGLGELTAAEEVGVGVVEGGGGGGLRIGCFRGSGHGDGKEAEVVGGPVGRGVEGASSFR